MKALAPGFLIAMPQLQDPNFEKAVVLMIEHSPEGAMGLIINHASQLTLGELAKTQSLALARTRDDERVCVGGPVEPFRGFVLHDADRIKQRTEVMSGLYLSVTSEALEPLLADASIHLRFCLGCSGWGPGQIEHELEEGSWLFSEADAGLVLADDPAEVWETVIRNMGIDPKWLVTSGGKN